MKGEVRRSPWDLGIAGLGVAVLFLTAQAVDPNRSPEAEQEVFYAINGLPDLIYWPVWVVMQLGNLLTIPVAAVVAFSFRRWALGAAILLAGVAKIYLSRGVKDLWTRERPAAVIDDVIRRGDASAAGEAFVSGHAVIAFALAVLVHRYVPAHRRWIPWALAATACVGRVYVGAHLPLDVVGGASLGSAVGLVLHFAVGSPAPAATTPAEVGSRPEAAAL